MIAKRMAQADILTRPPSSLPEGIAQRAGSTERASSEPAPLSLTYGSWMELGLAARQMMAAAQPRETKAAPAARRR